ncbi:MAG: right-handed parallel beta-helix repeat-containing protein [Halobacteriota archaeon]
MAILYVDIKNTSGVEDGSAERPYSKIQKAVDAANAGDTVKVAAGDYRENVMVNKAVNIEGGGTDITTVKALSEHEDVFSVKSNDVKISGFSIIGGSGSSTTYPNGVSLRGVSNVVITNNIISNFKFAGVLLSGIAGNNLIENNKIYSDIPWSFGILISQARNNEIVNNEISQVYRGIKIESSGPNNDNVITKNTITNISYRAFEIWGDTSGITIENNNIYNNSGYNFYNAAVSLGGCSAQNIKAPNNYWGTTDHFEIDAKIYDGKDNPAEGIVEYEPFLKAPFEVDTTTPSAPTLVQPPSPIKQTPITLTGTAEPKSTVQVFVNGVAQRNTTVSEAGSFSIDVDLNEGENRITAKAIDTSLNISEESQPVIVFLDTIPPDPPILNSLPSTTNKAKIIVEGNAEPNSEIKIFITEVLKSSARANGAGDFNIEVELEEGMNTITATARDAAGNISKPSSPVSVLYQKPEKVNIALNPSRSGYPHPLESDRGWGGGSDKWEIVDGKRTYPEWYHGLAFTGGRRNWAGEPCGKRQATINFGEPKTFYKVIIWHHGLMHIPKECKLHYWDGSKWVDIASKREVDLEGDYGTWSAPDTHVFTPVTGSKIRYVLNNCKESMEEKVMEHGWIYGFEVYGVVHPLENLPVIAIMGVGKSYAEKLEAQEVKTIRDMGLADVFTLGKKTGISLFTLYMWKRRASLAMDVKIDRALFSNILKMRLGDIIAMPDEELRSKANQPVETISDLKRDISTLLISLDNAIVKSMTIAGVAT